MAEVRERKSEGEGEMSAVTAPSKFPLTTNEVVLAVAIVGISLIGLACVLLTMPETDGSEVFKIPKTLDDLKLLRNFLERYARDYKSQVVLGYSFVYIFMQTFMIPGTVFMSLLAGSLFGVSKGVALVVFNATVGASCCFFLSKMIGKPLANLLWPSKIIFFQEQVAKRKENLLNYMLFLRVTPTLPNTFINVASPIVDVPYHTFFLATFLGLIPAAFLTVRAGITLGQLRSLADLYDFQALATLFVIGIISVAPALLNKTDKKAPA